MRISPTKEYSKNTKILDEFIKSKLRKQIKKIVANPEIGKPLRHLKGERVLYIRPFRLVYYYDKEKDILYLLKFDHRENIYST